MSKFLHVMVLEKFIAPFIEFVDKHFESKEHKYVLITSQKYQYGLQEKHNVEFLYTDEDIFQTLPLYMNQSEKIILHGLWRDKIDLLLLNNNHFLQKSYWVMWGGDFYFPEKQTDNRKKVIARIPYLVTGTSGEVAYVKEHYNASGKHLKAFVYTSNLFKEIDFVDREDSILHLLVGNSADPTNNHIEALEKLLPYKEEKILIHVPLSYGDSKHAMQVMKYGYEQFGEKFKPVIDFMSESDYIKFLSNIDIAIFHHNRQQGMGNIITLLGMGKKVYMNANVSTYKMFNENNIKLFNVDTITMDKMDDAVGLQNMSVVKTLFSENSFVKELEGLFYGF